MQPLRRGHIPNLLELLFLGELAKRFGQVVGILFGDKSQEVGQVQHSRSVVDFVHTVGNGGRNVDQSNELHFLVTRLEDFGNFVCNNTTVRVTRDGIRSMSLDLLHGIGVATDHLLHGGEDRLALIETAGAEGVEGALSVEVLGQVDEDQNFTDTGVNEEDRGFVAGGLKRDNGVISASVRGRGVECLMDQSGE